MGLWIALGALALLIVLLAVLYNRLVKLRNRVRAAWSDVDVQLKRRADLVPSLVAAVRGYMEHERQTLERVTALRSEGRREERPDERAELERELSRGLDHILLLAENYPDLKASGNFLDLQRQLAEVEDQIQYARRYYNGGVRDLNTAVESFPAVLLAGPMGFRQAAFFRLETPSERAAPAAALSGNEGE